ncbi:hypothetical protein AVEN_126483-1 [Araneus ventricosus]|uniref:Integrase catalytic domain-containing protein n=1 Tax=Araneus ventricosus TaxID=182803 RepID=A0A4Y2MN68_ARAVE|nr:hypothetical protein AVEN_126483-1 [Araneus ventricosus]
MRFDIRLIQRFYDLWRSWYSSGQRQSHSDQEASTVAEELVRAWISRYGVPILHSDQGTNFNSCSLCTGSGLLVRILRLERARRYIPGLMAWCEIYQTILNHLSLYLIRDRLTGIHIYLFLFSLHRRSRQIDEELGLILSSSELNDVILTFQRVTLTKPKK